MYLYCNLLLTYITVLTDNLIFNFSISEINHNDINHNFDICSCLFVVRSRHVY